MCLFCVVVLFLRLLVFFCVFSSSLASSSLFLLILNVFFSFYFQCEFLVFTSDPLSTLRALVAFLVVHSFTLFWLLSTWCLLLSFAFFSIVSVVVVTLLLLLLNFFVRLHFLDSLIYRRLSTLKFLTCFAFFFSC